MLRDAMAMPAIGGAEVRIELHGSRKLLTRLFVVCCSTAPLSQRIVADGVQRGRRQGLHGEALRGVRRLVTERRADGRRQAVATASTSFLSEAVPSAVVMTLAGHRLRRSHGDGIAAARRVIEPDSTTPKALLDRDLLRRPFVEPFGGRRRRSG